MSDTVTTPEPRPSKDVQKEYGILCGIAGDKQYRVQALRAELDELNQKLYGLNQEFNASLAKEKESKTHLESVKDETTPTPEAPVAEASVL